MAEKLDMKLVLALSDCKVYNAWDEMTDEERKAFTPFITQRWSSVVFGTKQQQAEAILRTNEYINMHQFTLGSKHKKLYWLLTAAAGQGRELKHGYVGTKRAGSAGANKLAQIYPNHKLDDLETMAKLMSPKEIDRLVDEHTVGE